MLMVITVLSLALASTLALVTWRVLREERRRSDARVAALAAAIEADADQPTPRAVPYDDGQVAVARETPSLTPRAAIAAVAIGVLAIGGAAVALSSGRDGVEHRQTSTTPEEGTRDAGHTRTSTASTPGIALLALTHERRGDGLEVRGAIRAAHIPPDAVVAVVLGFDADGSFVISERAQVDTAAAGADRGMFRLLLPQAGAVSRYRVSFRNGDAVIPHVDERVQERS